MAPQLAEVLSGIIRTWLVCKRSRVKGSVQLVQFTYTYDCSIIFNWTALLKKLLLPTATKPIQISPRRITAETSPLCISWPKSPNVLNGVQ